MAVITAPANLNLVGSIGIPVSYNVPNATYSPAGVYTTEYTVQSGSLPPGISTFNPSLNTPFSSVLGFLIGFLSGTPTLGGVYSFVLRWFESGDPSNFSDQTINIHICDLILTPSTLPNGTIGTPYSQIITASNETAPYSLSIGSGALPTGLSGVQISTTEFQISGTPTAIGTYSFQIDASDASSPACTGVQAYSITISIKKKKKIKGALVSQPPTLCMNRFDKFGNKILCKETFKYGNATYQRVSMDEKVCCYKRIS